MNPQGKRVESSQSKNHEEHIAGKGFTSMLHYNWVDKFIVMSQAMKIPDAKTAVDKEWKKLETIPSMEFGKSHEQKGRYSGSTKRQKESPLCYIDGHMSPQKCRVGTVNCRSIEAESCSSGANAVFTEQGSSASQMTAAKATDVVARLPVCDGQAADAVSAYAQVTLEDAPRLLKIPKSECSDVWIRLPRHKWPKSSSNTGDPVVLLERNLYGHPTRRIVVGKTVRRTFSGTWI